MCYVDDTRGRTNGLFAIYVKYSKDGVEQAPKSIYIPRPHGTDQSPRDISLV